MTRIKNDCISLSLDDRGRIVELKNIKTGKGNVISRPVSLFRAILRVGNHYEEIAWGDQAELTITASNNQAFIYVTKLYTQKETADVEIKLVLSLDGEKVLFDEEIINHDQVTVMDFFYPCIGAIQSLGFGNPNLLFPAGYGEYHKDIISKLKATGGRDTARMLSGIYPFTMSMQYMILTDQDQCLYLSAQDSKFHILSMLAVGSENGDVTMEFDRMAFIGPGEKWKSDQKILWLYQGTWQKGAETYRRWAEKWMEPVTPPAWIQESNGCLKVICKQEYGAETYPYDQIPALYEIAQANGCDVLTLFNALWTDHRGLEGPLEIIESLGGEKTLKTSIDKVHEMGGYVVFHYNGNKMEVNSPFYTTVGRAMANRNHWGNPYFEQYGSVAESDFIKYFGLKTTVAICPSCSEWQNILLYKCRQMKELGADGVVFEEVGGLQRYVHNLLCAPMPYPCFRLEHHHANPCTAYTQGRIELLRHIQEEPELNDGGFALMIESVSDLFSQYSDCVYGISSHKSTSERDCAHQGGSQPGLKGERSVLVHTDETYTLNMPELFRHTFPNVISTINNKNPSLTARQVNYALCYGFRFEMSVCSMKDKQFLENSNHSEYHAYAKDVCALRKKYSSLLLKGTYSCDSCLAQANPCLNHGLFITEGQECLVLWNDTDQTLPINLCNRHAIRWETIELKGDDAPECILPNRL